jgi:cytochrome P450
MSHALAHIPGSSGPPLVGHTLSFMRDGHALMDRSRLRYGDVFRINLLGRASVVFLTPQATREIFLDPGRVLSSEGGWQSSIGTLFRRGLMLRDFDDHRLHRRVMQQAFSRSAMTGYMGTIHDVVRREVGRLGPGPIDMYQFMKRLNLAIAAEVFVGEAMGPQADRVTAAFVAAVLASLAPLRLDVPGTVYGRGMRGRRELEAYFGRLVHQRRTGPSGQDLLSRLAHATTETGAQLPVDEVVDHMIFLMLAAHDTTTSALSVLLWELARNPLEQQRVVAEVSAFGDQQVTLDNHRELVLVGRALQEAMRLAPPVPASPRLTTADVVIDGVPVPAGTMVSSMSMSLHRHPRWWTHPERFDPDRFSPERAEHKQHSHLYVPFGGGAHLCIGNHFAEIVVKAVVVQLLNRRAVEVTPGRPVVLRPVPIPKPQDTMMLTLR